MFVKFNFLKKDNVNTEYEILVPPFEKTPEEMTPTQAKKYFEWYISQVPSRVNYISTKCGQSLNLSKGMFNCTSDSLILIWKWFLSVAQVEESPKESIDELRNSMSGMPESFIQHITNYEKRRFSLITAYIMRDIGMYLGEVFVKNYSYISWGFYTKPKRDFFVNQPVLQGFEDKNYEPVFKPNFEPIHMVSVQAANIFDKTANKNDLYNLYAKWTQYT